MASHYRRLAELHAWLFVPKGKPVVDSETVKTHYALLYELASTGVATLKEIEDMSVSDFLNYLEIKRKTEKQ